MRPLRISSQARDLLVRGMADDRLKERDDATLDVISRLTM